MPRSDLKLLPGDALEVLRKLPDGVARCCVTSPPYWGLRDYGADGQLGLEVDPEAYVGRLVEIFREVRRVLADDGTLWLNLGDSYAGSWGAQARQGSTGVMAARPTSVAARQIAAAARKGSRTGSVLRSSGLKPKDLVGIPWRVAFALRADGWWLRSDIIWAKPCPIPENVKDRPTKSHEYVFLLAKQPRYFYDAAAVMEPATGQKPGNKTESKIPGEREGANANIRSSLHKIQGRLMRNRRSVWRVYPKPFKGAHFATMPPALVRPCVLAGSERGDTVIDPFNGAGTTGLVALSLGRRYIGIDINQSYLDLTRERLSEIQVELPLVQTP